MKKLIWSLIIIKLIIYSDSTVGRFSELYKPIFVYSRESADTVLMNANERNSGIEVGGKLRLP